MTSNQAIVAMQIIVCTNAIQVSSHADEEVLMVYVNVFYFSAEVAK